MYPDPRRIKHADGIKTRLDDYDQARLSLYLEKSGEQAAVFCREAVIEKLDRLGVRYENPVRNLELDQRLTVIAVTDQIRQANLALGAANTGITPQAAHQ
tara:strand:- start:219 stop:518 length:300 start_codon:yes stop_codon:yes gene_type:complete